MSPSDKRPIFHPWTKSPPLYTRTLTTVEYMLSMLNDHALGHNSPYLGATISVQSTSSEPSPLFTIQEDLQSRAVQAFIKTRWTYPMVACQIRECNRITYAVEEEAQVAKWAERTVRVVQQDGGWSALRDNLSRDVVLPDENGDCVFLYIVVPSGLDAQGKEFDILLHFHHGLTDGAGARSVLNEVLMHLASPERHEVYSWGMEAERLLPAALDVANISDEMIKALTESLTTVSNCLQHNSVVSLRYSR
jgi:hypothetical protein